MRARVAIHYADARAIASKGSPREGGCWVAREGTCGKLRFIESAGTFTGGTEYFDASGRLVAASTHSDARSACHHTSFSAFYGPPPRCRLLVTTDYCPQPP